MNTTALRDAHLHPQRAILSQAVPIVLGQVAVLANGVIDNIMAGHAGSHILAAMAVGSSVYVSLYVGLMGVIIGLTPICSAHHGANKPKEVALDVAQGIWIASGLSVIGMLILLQPQFLFALTDTPEDIAVDAKDYLAAVAYGLPAALVFRVFYAMNQSISRPALVMALQMLMLVLKVPLNVWFLHGGYGLPALGAAGFAWASTATMWLVLVASLLIWKLDPFYRPYQTTGLQKPAFKRIKKILALGLPIGASYLIEVTSFTFIALLVSRFGIFEVGGHQIVSNLAALAYMLALGIGNATTVTTAQQLGAQNYPAAALMVKHGLRLAMITATGVCTLFFVFDHALISLYTNDPNTLAVALQLMPWAIAYHFIDAFQTVCSFSLRAYQVSGKPLLVYLVSLWGVGIGGGLWLGVWQPSPLHAQGFWIASVGGLALAACGLAMLLRYTIRVYAARHIDVNAE
jgi:MATE family multidrug resistance protein